MPPGESILVRVAFCSRVGACELGLRPSSCTGSNGSSQQGPRGVFLDRPRPAALVAAAILAVILVVGSTVAPRVAEAGPLCPAGAGGGETLVAFDAGARLNWIDRRLARTAHAARIWTWGWGVGIGVATVGNLVPLLFVAPDDRIDWYTGAATTIVGIVPLLIAPLDVIDDSRALHAKIIDTPPRVAGVHDDDTCLLLRDAESRLVRDAQNQSDGKRWWLHVGNVVLNTGVGLFLGFGYHHWGAGAFNAVFGSAIGELIIFHAADGQHRRPARL